jgi:DNA polymerase III delta prime subunit
MEHHAYLLLGEKQAGKRYIQNILNEQGIASTGNPDVRFVEADVFGVDDSRSLGEEAQVKAFGSKKIFVISASRFTDQAQNALLKTFEEPTAGTHFFVVGRDENMFLPTLLSRMQTVRLDSSEQLESEAEKFLKMPLAKRILFARKFADEKEERGVGALADFLDSLLAILKKENAPLSALEKVFKIRLFADDPSAMSRLIIEHLSLVLG